MLRMTPRGKKLLAILLSVLAVATSAGVSIVIVRDRKLVDTAERVRNREDLAEFERLCPDGTSIAIHHSGWTRRYEVPFWIPFLVRKIEFYRERGKWPPSISSEIALRWQR